MKIESFNQSNCNISKSYLGKPQYLMTDTDNKNSFTNIHNTTDVLSAVPYLL